MVKLPFELIFKLIYGRNLLGSATDGDAVEKLTGLLYSSVGLVVPQIFAGVVNFLVDPHFEMPWPYSDLNKVSLASALSFRSYSGIVFVPNVPNPADT